MGHASAVPLTGEDAREAVAVAYRRFYPELRRYALRFIAFEDVADDIVQEVFLHILRQPDCLGSVIDVSAYLYRAVHNEALHRTERLHYARTQPEVARTERSRLAPSPAQEMSRRVLEADLDRAIELLPPRCRQAFRLIRIDGLSYAEAAAAMGISIKTVKEQMRRTRQRLRELLPKYASDHSF